MTRFLDTHATLGGRKHLYEGGRARVPAASGQGARGRFRRHGSGRAAGLSRLVIGSTAERVLDRLPCDLIIIKPLEFEVTDVD